MKNKVLLAMTRDGHIFECIKDNLNFMGKDCELLNIPISIKDLNNKSLVFKLKLFIKLKILKNKKYVLKYNKDFYEENVISKIRKEGSDYESCLMIRPDVYTEGTVDTIITNIKKTYAYQWDGLDRFPKVLKLIPKFAHFYIYDKNDKDRFPNTSLITNFYFDCYLDKNKKNPTFDVYYIGSFDDRINDVIDVCTRLNELNLKLKILIYCRRENKGKLKKYPFITEIYNQITYYQNLENVFDSKIILDFGHKSTHTGLSLRPFEALGYGKKLITTNRIIKDYDFYNEKNILLIDQEKNKENLIDFINSDYEPLNKDIYDKHSFSSWFNTIFN